VGGGGGAGGGVVRRRAAKRRAGQGGVGVGAGAGGGVVGQIRDPGAAYLCLEERYHRCSMASRPLLFPLPRRSAFRSWGPW
jgi:hypothetical protein